jgi:predicted SAM-dependent methyltransferase
MKLNVGCGKDIREGFTNVDKRKLPGVDVVCDLTDVSRHFDYETCDYILARDVLEHFDRATYYQVLESLVKLLKPGGVIEIQAPDIIHLYKVAKSFKQLELMLYGGQDYPENSHKSGHTIETVTDDLEVFGCEVIESEHQPSGNFHMKARKR